MQRLYDDKGQAVMLKAAEPAGKMIRREIFSRAGIELRLYQQAESFTLWLVELGDEQPEAAGVAQVSAADFFLQADYAGRIWGEQAEPEAQGHFARLLERLVELYGAENFRAGPA